MDPNANLAEQDRLLNAETRTDKQRRSELRQALQAWIASGGFQPTWNAYPTATAAYRKWVRNAKRFQDLYR